MIIKQYFLKELAALYGVHRNTFKRWLDRKGIIYKRGYIPAEKVKEIFEKLGLPTQEVSF